MNRNIYKKIIPALTCFLAAMSAEGATVVFDSGPYKVIEVTPDRNTGLETLYVAYNTNHISRMIITPQSGASITSISKYSNLGGGYAQPVAYNMEGANAIVEKPEGDMGYLIEENGRNYCIWLVNYANHMLDLKGISASEQQDCDNTTLNASGSGAAIHYYSIDGRQCELSRDLEVVYNSLEWSEDNENFEQVSLTKTLPHLTSVITITPPIYCNTVFTLSGDRFMEAWGLARSVHSETVSANGILQHTTAEQTNAETEDEEADASNVIKTETQGLGGSAPVDISFRAWTTDAVVHNEWQIASDEMFENIDYRFNEQELDYSFTQEGTWFVRFVGSNADGSCETYGDVYTIGVGSSELRIPNAFTPNGDGINDVWKVAYRSLLSFNCSIFDRYGTLLYSFSDPNQGWDGKYKGKLVKPGVYFYVLEAKGADGKTYKKGGDINIIGSKKYSLPDSPVSPDVPEE